MTEKNKTHIRQLKVAGVSRYRFTIAYGQGTDFPAHLTVLERIRGLASIKKSLYVFITNPEHQDTLWHVILFGTVSLNRILEKALMENGQNPVTCLLVKGLLDSFACILQCSHDGGEMGHASLLLCFSNLLKEGYLWSEEYNREEDEMRYEEDEVLLADLLYSFYHYS